MILEQTKKLASEYSPYDIAKATGLCHKAIYNLLGKSKYPTLDTIERVLKVLGYKLTIEKIK